MDKDRLHEPDDDFTAIDATVVSSSSPYQPTTEPVLHRRSLFGGLVIEMHYVKSLPGILKVIEVVFSIAAAISVGCVDTCDPCAPFTFMQFVSITAILVTSLLYVVFVLCLHLRADIINWPLTDFINCIVSSGFYLIASCVLVTNAQGAPDKSAVAFGFLNTILYAASIWFAYKVFIIEYRKRHSAVSHIKGVADQMETETLS